MKLVNVNSILILRLILRSFERQLPKNLKAFLMLYKNLSTYCSTNLHTNVALKKVLFFAAENLKIMMSTK